MKHATTARSDWQHVITDYQPEAENNLETLFTQSNGYMGIRGYAEEGPSEATSDPMQFVAGYFDRSPVTRNTMVNLPTLRRIGITLNGEALDLSTGTLRDYTRTLDLRSAVSTRSFTWTSPRGRTTYVSFTSFLSYLHPHIHATAIVIKPENWSGTAHLEDVFDGSRPTLNQRHFDITQAGALPDGHLCVIRTRTSQLDAGLAAVYRTPAHADWGHPERDELSSRRRFAFPLRAGRSSRLYRYLGVTTDFDRDARHRPARARATTQAQRARSLGWTTLLKAQKDAWRTLWQQADVVVSGDPERQFKLRFSIFQLLQAYRSGDSRLSIGTKFLSGEHYSGHHFWDTDHFLTPFYLFTMPDAGRDLVAFRLRHLDGARLKAKEKKCKGAFYPWEACPFDGRENCPEWWQDKAATEPTHIPCGEIELHINTSVAMLAKRFLDLTNYTRPSRQEINALLIELARFWASRGVWENGRYRIKRVIGPDEYHEFVDDNAYTNHTARWNLQQALDAVSTPTAARRHKVTASEIAAWQAIVDGIELGIDPTRGLIAQDATFLSLPELDFSAYRGKGPLFRQMSIEEIGKHQAIKQADVLTLFHQLPFAYDHDLMQRCYDYYEPRTLHDSNLSAGSHAVAAALLRRRDDFVRYYDQVLDLDIGGQSYNVMDGLHAANAGNAWSATIMGAAGIRWTASELYCSPLLPEGWTALRFSIYYRGRRLTFKVKPNWVELDYPAGRDISLVVAGRRVRIGKPAGRLRLSTRPLAVVFDLDGVLVDSAICHYRAWQRIADDIGVAFDEKKNDLLRGVSRRESLMIMLGGQKALTEPEISDLLHRKNELYKKMIAAAGEALLLPGVKPFLSRLKLAGVKLAVASSSKNAPALLKQAGLDQYYFDAIAHGGHIKESKPHPEVFLLAAQQLGLPPADCLCVEDAPAGIESGHRAGMKTLGIGPADLGSCTWHRSSIAAIPADELFDLLAVV
jgi:beta-phosphoglucomutase